MWAEKDTWLGTQGACQARAGDDMVKSQPLTGEAGWAPVSCSIPEIKGSVSRAIRSHLPRTCSEV